MIAFLKKLMIVPTNGIMTLQQCWIISEQDVTSAENGLLIMTFMSSQGWTRALIVTQYIVYKLNTQAILL